MSSALGLLLQFNCLRKRHIYVVFSYEVCQKYMWKWMWGYVSFEVPFNSNSSVMVLLLQNYTIISFLPDKDLDKLLTLLRSPDKPTEWAEICSQQFCKVMKTSPDSISGPSEYDLRSLTRKAGKRPLVSNSSYFH